MDMFTMIQRVLVIGLAIAFLISGYIDYKGNQTLEWYRVDGVITSTSIREESDDDGTSYYPVIYYSYRDEYGTPYLGDRIKFGNTSNGNRRSAQAFLNRYPVDSKVNVYHNPDNVQDAVLEKRQRRRVPIVGILLLLVFLWSIADYIHSILYMRKHREKATGIITHACENPYTEPSADMWDRVDVHYQYHYQGRDYVARTLSYRLAKRFKTDIAGWLRRYPVGRKIKVYFNPKNPQQAVLDPNMPQRWVMGLVFSLLGVLVTALALYIIMHPAIVGRIF